MKHLFINILICCTKFHSDKITSK